MSEFLTCCHLSVHLRGLQHMLEDIGICLPLLRGIVAAKFLKTKRKFDWICTLGLVLARRMADALLLIVSVRFVFRLDKEFDAGSLKIGWAPKVKWHIGISVDAACWHCIHIHIVRS